MSGAVDADPRIGSEVAGYRVERLLGRGGVSVVYLAEDLLLDRKVALKLLGPELSSDARFRERFLGESRLVGSFDHANVIAVYEVGDADGVLFVAMRYVEGSDLTRLLAGEGRLDPERAVDLVSQAAAGLDASRWGRGLVHGNVRPSNVLVEGAVDPGSVGHVGLVDFGLWQQVERASLLADGARAVGYLAPEQVLGEEPTSRIDQYALACVLYECLTGQPPFVGEASTVLDAHLQQRPRIARALEKRPEDRHGTCGEFASALSATPAPAETWPVTPAAVPEWSAGETDGALPDGPLGAVGQLPAATSDRRDPTPASPPARPWPGRLAPSAIGVLAVTVAILLALLLVSNGTDEPAAVGTEPPSGDNEPVASDTEPLSNDTEPASDGTELFSDGTEPFSDGTEPAGDGAEADAATATPPTTQPARFALPPWSRVSPDEAMFGGAGDQWINSVTAGGPGLVAVGRDGGSSERGAAVWTSVDGITWSRVDHDASVFGGGQMNSVTGAGPGLVAVGATGPNAAVWTSVDGLSWSRVPHDGAFFGGEMRTVTVRGSGLVAVGSADSGGGVDAAVWTSVDGLTWSQVPHDDEAVFGGEGAQEMSSVTAGGPGLVAVGWDGSDAAVWTSVDGLSWSRVPRDESVFGGEGDQEMRSVAVGGPGLVAVGVDGSDAAVWTSVDGLSWSRVPRDESVFDGEGDQEMVSVSTSAAGTFLVAVGSDGPDATVWASRDGVTWARPPDGTSVFGADGEHAVLSVTAAGPGLVAVGSDGSDGAVWWSEVREPGAAVEISGDGVEIGGDGGEPLRFVPGSVVRIDPETSQIAAVIGTAYEAPFVAVGEGTVWVREWEGNFGRTVTQIDPETSRVVRTIGIVGEVTGMAIGEGSVWVTSSLAGEGVLVEIDARTGRLRRAVALGYSGLAAVAVGEGAVWVAAAGGNVALRIEPTTGEVVAAIPLPDRPLDVTVGEGAVWVVGGRAEDVESGPGTVWRIDPGTNEVVATIELSGSPTGAAAIATGAGAVWVVGRDAGIFRIDPATNRITATIPGYEDDGGVAVGRGSVWVVNHQGSNVRRIDQATNQVIVPATNERFDGIGIQGLCGCSVAVGAGGVWAS